MAARRSGTVPDMRLRRRSKKQTLADAVGTYLKFKAISKAAKTARKSIKGYAAYKATKKVASRPRRR